MRAATKDSTADSGYPKLSKEEVEHSTAAERTSPLHSKLINSLAIVKTRSASGKTPGPTALMREPSDSKADAFSAKLDVLIPTLRPLTRAAGINSLSPSSSSLSSGISVKTTLDPAVCKRLGRITGSQGAKSRPINWAKRSQEEGRKSRMGSSAGQEQSCSSTLAMWFKKPGRQAFNEFWMEGESLTARRTRLRASTARHWILRDWEASKPATRRGKRRSKKLAKRLRAAPE